MSVSIAEMPFWGRPSVDPSQSPRALACVVTRGVPAHLTICTVITITINNAKVKKYLLGAQQIFIGCLLCKIVNRIFGLRF